MISRASSRQPPRVVAFVPSSKTATVEPLYHTTDLHLTDSWADVERGIHTCDVVVLVADHRVLRDLAPHVAALQGSAPTIPVILVTDPHPESWRRLSGVTFASILWMEELSAALWPAVRRAVQNTSLGTLHDRVVLATRLSPPLRLTIEHILMRRPPVQSIRQLVTEVGYARTTLWQYWDREIRNDSSFRLHDFMDWVLLCRAAGLRTRGETRKEIAAALGIDPRTLTHRVLRLTTMSMPQFEALSESQVFEQFLAVLRCIPALRELCDDPPQGILRPLLMSDSPIWYTSVCADQSPEPGPRTVERTHDL